MKNNTIVEFGDEKSVQNFFTKTASGMVAFVSGLLTSDRNDYILATGRMIQAGLRGRTIKQFGQEISEMMSKGKIKDNWFEGEYSRMLFVELLDFIDNEIPDEEKLKAMKALFFMSASTSEEYGHDRISYELMIICRQLNSGDILILKSLYKLAIDPSVAKTNNINIIESGASTWFINVAKLMGHNIPSLVENHEEKLFKLKLISKRTYTDLSGFEATPYYRMTGLGYKLCDFIAKF